MNAHTREKSKNEEERARKRATRPEAKGEPGRRREKKEEIVVIVVNTECRSFVKRERSTFSRTLRQKQTRFTTKRGNTYTRGHPEQHASERQRAREEEGKRERRKKGRKETARDGHGCNDGSLRLDRAKEEESGSALPQRHNATRQESEKKTDRNRRKGEKKKQRRGQKSDAMCGVAVTRRKRSTLPPSRRTPEKAMLSQPASRTPLGHGCDEH